MSRLLALLVITTATSSFAETFTGQISDPALRRAVELVYIEKVPGNYPPPKTAPIVTQKNNVYLPKVLPVVVGTKVSFQSEDKELHNVFARKSTKVLFNQAQLTNQSFDRTFSEVGQVHLTCNIHKEMSAWILVLQNPFFAKPDPKTGQFTIDGVPAGRYVLRVWGEKLDEEDLDRTFPITVAAGAAPLIVSSR